MLESFCQIRHDPEYKDAKDGFSRVKRLERKQRAADAALESRDWTKAAELYEDALTLDKELPMFNHRMTWGLCQAQYNEHKYETAAKTCQLVLDIEPEHEGAADLKVRSLMENEQYDLAVQEVWNEDGMSYINETFNLPVCFSHHCVPCLSAASCEICMRL